MNKTCIYCGTQIPMIASRCPNCTTHLNGSGSIGGGNSDAGGILAVFFLMIVFGVGNCLGLIK